MEGISQADYSTKENKLNLQSVIDRALYEELGIGSDHLSSYATEMNYCDFI